jgi:prolycopene isomerase
MAQRTSKKNMQMKVSGYKTPIDGLVIGGHWAEFGGGVPIAVKAAANATAIILKKDSPKHFKELCAVLDTDGVQDEPVYAPPPKPRTV